MKAKTRDNKIISPEKTIERILNTLNNFLLFILEIPPYDTSR